MPTNKNAQLRYQIIDKCLSNWSRRYYIEDLVDACNEALYLYNGETKDGCGVKKRQVQEDLKFIESEEGYSMEIDAIRDGHRKYYRYHTKGASIKNQPINQIRSQENRKPRNPTNLITNNRTRIYRIGVIANEVCNEL